MEECGLRGGVILVMLTLSEQLMSTTLHLHHCSFHLHLRGRRWVGGQVGGGEGAGREGREGQ